MTFNFLARTLLWRQSAARRHLVGLTTVVLLTCLLLSPLFSDVYHPWFSMGLTDSNSVALWTENDFMLAAIGKRSQMPALASGALLEIAAFPVVSLWLLVAVGSVLRLWLGIGAVFWFKPAAGSVELTRIRRLMIETAKDLEITNAPKLLLSSRVASPMAWGPPLSRLVFPLAAATWSDAQLKMSLRHELGHIYRIDSPSQVLARLVCALLWFHPLVWILQARLLRDQEEACDNLVVEAGESATGYARHLLATFESGAKRPAIWAQLHGRRVSPIATRIHRLLEPDVKRQRVTRRLGMAIIVLVPISWLGLLTPGLSWTRALQPAGAPTLTPESAVQLVDVLAEGLKQYEIPGGVIVVVRKGETILSRSVGVADREAKQSVDVDKTLFRIGSISKPVTALGLLKVLEEKGVSLDAAVQPTSRRSKCLRPRQALSLSGTC